MEKFLISLCICSAVMSVIALFYMGLSQILKNVWSAKRRYYVWLIILVGFITPFKPSLGFPIYEINIDQYNETVLTVSATERFDVAAVLFLLWVAGMLILTVRHGLCQYRFRKQIKRLSRPCSPQTVQIAEATAKQMGIKRVLAVTVSGIASPMMTGFCTPMILLPDTAYSAPELRLIMKHELSHFKRRDLIYKLFLLVCQTVHWFNPFMKVIANRIDQDCELACDETVMHGENQADRKLYCQSILAAVSAQNKNSSVLKPVTVSNFGNAKGNLRHRLQMILLLRQKKKLGFLCVLILLITAFSGTVLAATSTEPYFAGTKPDRLTATTITTSTTVIAPSNFFDSGDTGASPNDMVQSTTTASTRTDSGYTDTTVGRTSTTTALRYYEGSLP